MKRTIVGFTLVMMSMFSPFTYSSPVSEWKTVKQVLDEFNETKDFVKIEYLGKRCGGLYFALGVAVLKRGREDLYDNFNGLMKESLTMSAISQIAVENPNLPNRLGVGERTILLLQSNDPVSNAYIERMEENFIKYASLWVDDDLMKNDFKYCSEFIQTDFIPYLSKSQIDKLKNSMSK